METMYGSGQLISPVFIKYNLLIFLQQIALFPLSLQLQHFFNHIPDTTLATGNR